MNKLSVLDVTLRDGGCVNNFNFGQEYMEKILEEPNTLMNRLLPSVF